VCDNSGSVLAALATVVPFIIDLTIGEAVVACVVCLKEYSQAHESFAI
jgi:hypothetical protein